MKSEWTKKKLSDIADFNPRETVKKGAIAKKIPMDVLRPFYRDIPYYVEECFSGGTKFRNGAVSYTHLDVYKRQICTL